MIHKAIYKQFKVSLDPELFHSFKKVCAESRVSMASVISQFMAGYIETQPKAKGKAVSACNYSTRRRRRAVIGKIIKELEQIKENEEDYSGRIPENLKSSSVYDKAEEFISCFDTAIEALESIESI